MIALEVWFICFMNRRRVHNSQKIKAEASCMALALQVEINVLFHEAPSLTGLHYSSLMLVTEKIDF